MQKEVSEAVRHGQKSNFVLVFICTPNCGHINDFVVIKMPKFARELRQDGQIPEKMENVSFFARKASFF